MEETTGMDNCQFPCSHCYASRKQFRNPLHCLNAFERTLSSVYTRVVARLESPKTSLVMSDNNLPLFYSGGNCCNSIEFGVDILHLIENVGVCVLEVAALHVRACFRDALAEKLKACASITISFKDDRAQMSNTSCANVRRGFMLVHEIFPQPYWQSDDECTPQFLKTFSRLCCLLYSGLAHRSSQLIIAIYVHVFHFYHQAEEHFSKFEWLFSLPFHQLVCHIPFLARKYYLADLTTESFEALWKDLRFFETYLSNHHEKSVSGWLMRQYFCSLLKETVGTWGATIQANSTAFLEEVYAPVHFSSSITTSDKFKHMLSS